MAVLSWAPGKVAFAVIAIWITCVAGGCRLLSCRTLGARVVPDCRPSVVDWPIEQLQRFQLPDRSSAQKLKHYYTRTGVGVPVLAFRAKPIDSSEDPIERFIPSQFPVATTFVLCTRSEGDREFVIEVANPLRVDAVQVADGLIPIAKDLSCPLEYQLRHKPTNPITGFLLPGSGNQDDGLRWSEPYRRGKIPVVFIHGLMSEPTAWMDMVNQLRRYRWFNQHYQVWGFGYATGSPFVTSAMRLRNQCNEALCLVDPNMEDLALQNMVLIGHSMGGLLAKLQVADSGDRLWRSVSRVPLDRLKAPEQVKKELGDRLFFASQNHVKRVVYIATPHRGSSFASRAPGRFFSSFVRPDEQNQAMHEKLVADNPNAFFGTFRKRIPSSVDLLEPNDASLQAIFHLPIPDHVQQHTILGTGETLITLGNSDGVVSVESASHPSARSEVHVDASHTKIHSDDATIAEIVRLLRLHLLESGMAPSPPDS